MAMNNATAELLLIGAVQVADDIPGIGPHARPAEMCKKGYLVDLRDGNTRVISDQQRASKSCLRSYWREHSGRWPKMLFLLADFNSDRICFAGRSRV
jgi:hypothetical protein